MENLIIKTYTTLGNTFFRAEAPSKEGFIKEFNEKVEIARQKNSEPPLSVSVGGYEIRLDCKSEVFTIEEFLRSVDGKNNLPTPLNSV